MEDVSKYLTVHALTRYLKMRFDTDENLQTIFLKGEISNFKAHTSGHLYFSLKDETSKINAIMFSRNASKLNFMPKDGKKVLVTGRVSIYEASGSYQIYVEEMLEDGLGNLYIAFEKLKEKLKEEGLFKEEHKKKIPRIPERIGIITAPTGAAIKDILSTIRRRFPIATTILFPSLVQGENAKEDLVKNIKLSEHYDLDVLIIGRGGGSIEDLWPFNEEMVARAIYECKIPIISAVGHEIDYTISDFVADLRAPTPTGAAELAVPEKEELMSYLLQLKIRLGKTLMEKIKTAKASLERFQNSYVLKNPMALFEIESQKLDTLKETLNATMLHFLEKKRFLFEHKKNSYLFLYPEALYKEKENALMHNIQKLELLNPLRVLKRGYAIPYQKGNILHSVKEVKKEALELHLVDGIIEANVVDIKEKKNGKKEKI